MVSKHSIQEAAADEFDAVRELYREYRALLEREHNGFCAFCDGEIAALPGEYRIYVYRVDVRSAGCIALRDLGSGVAEIKRLYVADAARGRGAGRALTEFALAEARRLGFARVRLDTLAGMRQAIALYRALGFVEIPPYHARPLPGALYFEREL